MKKYNKTKNKLHSEFTLQIHRHKIDLLKCLRRFITIWW